MQTVLAIFIGGGLGSLARYGLSQWLGKSGSGFPIGTLVANVAACLILGIGMGLIAKYLDVHPQMRNFLLIGFCGGFSTFSTFSGETFVLFDEGKAFLALTYVALSIITCVFSFWGGMSVSKLF